LIAAALRHGLAAACGLLLCACAGQGGGPSAELPGQTRELRTVSEQTSNEKRASIRLQLAVGYYQAGSYEIALDEVKKAIDADPQMANAYGVRALIYSAMNEMALAEENFQRALRLAPNNPDLANNYGLFLCQVGRHAQGLAQFEAALKNPKYTSPVKALVNAGACSLKMKSLDAAERYLLEALRYEPDLLATNAGLAGLYWQRRDLQRAGFFVNRMRAVARTETWNAEQLWQAVRIEHALRNRDAEASLVAVLRRQYPASPEFAAFQRGAFDE
jgi:type IV pilus assembly protein PilF